MEKQSQQHELNKDLREENIMQQVLPSFVHLRILTVC